MLSVIIVSYNTEDLLRTCLTSLCADIDPAATEIVVIDNASLDGSVAMVEKEFPRVRLIRNRTNSGFAAANNQGFAQATGDDILLLNSDTRVVPGAIAQLLLTMQADSRIGVVGAKLLNHDGSLQPSAGYFPFLWPVAAWMLFIDDLFRGAGWMHSYHIEDPAWYRRRRRVDWVTGACFLVSRAAWEKTGGFDEQLFMYGEEVEWCYRIRQAGYQVVYTPEAQVYHTKGASASHRGGAGIAEEFTSLLYFYRKHLPPWQLPLLRGLLYLGAWFRLLIFGIIGRHRERLNSYAQALAVVGR